MRSIPATFDELAEALILAADLALEERAAIARERELDALLAGRTVPVDGLACTTRVRGETLILSAPGARARPIRLLTPECAVAATALAALEPRAAETLEALRRSRQRIRLLRERGRLADDLREIERRRDALERLRDVEVRAAEKARQKLVRRERLHGRPVPPPLARPVAAVVVDRARALAHEAKRVREQLARCREALEHAPSARGPEAGAFLADLRALAPLLSQRVAVEYRLLEREMLSEFRALALGADPVRRGGESTPGAKRFLAQLAFLMAKSNFTALSREDLERGFEIGPAPGVRLHVPLSDFEDVYLFARGPKLEPLPGGGLAPRFEKFAYCLLRARGARPGRPRSRAARFFRRLRIGAARRARRHIVPRVEGVIHAVRQLARMPPPEVAVDPPLAIKLFRDVRLGECGLVLPGAAIRYRARDLALVALGAAGGLWSKVAEKPLAALFAPKIALSLFLASAFKGLLGMRRSRITLDKLRDEYENRHLQATRMNAVEYFLREAAEMDAKEVLLAYLGAALDRLERDEPLDGAEGRERPPAASAGPGGEAAPGPAGWPVRPRALLGRIESFLRAHLRASVRFDLEDALGGLEAFGLIRPPGLYAGGGPVAYFDPRLTSASFREDAEVLLARADARVRRRGSEAPRTLEEALARAAERDAEETARRDAGRPWRGRDPVTGAPRWWPADDDADAPRFPREEATFLPLREALGRIKRDLRARLGLDD